MSAWRMTGRRGGPGSEEDGMALLTTIMLIMVVGSLSVLMLGVVVAQVKPTLFGAKYSRTIVAAEAGVDAALSQIRSATSKAKVSQDVLGDPKKLPCSVEGRVSDESGEYAYTATVDYFLDDPRGKDAAWRATNSLKNFCEKISRPVPAFAVISSRGTDATVPGRAASSGDRTLESVYTFQTINQNIQGGPIFAFGNGYCLQADGLVAGSTISYVNGVSCVSGDERQQWSWKDDYKIHLSVSDLGSTPLCITGRPTGQGLKTQAKLEACTPRETTTALGSSQLYSWHGGALFKVQNEANDSTKHPTRSSNPSWEFCLGTGASGTAVTNGTKLMVGNCGTNATWSSFAPSPKVGAAAASKATNQIVNFAEFGRCADVTNTTITYKFMIVYPCKQNPALSGGDAIEWNHRWFYTEPCQVQADSSCGLFGRTTGQQVTVKVSNTTTWCMKTAAAGASPAYVTFSSSCTGTDVTWFRSADTGDKQTSWRFEDSYGRCLAIGPKGEPLQADLPNWSTMVVAECSSAPDQKWNAPAFEQDATVDSYREVNG